MDTIGSAPRHSRRLRYFAAGSLLVAGLSVTPATAHFVLEAPAASLEQNQVGDPQKLGPCGGTSENAGTPTGAVTELTGGSMLHLKVREVIFHPGHYRVALAPGEAGLPDDPETLTREGPAGPISVSARIAANPVPPVLADGLFQHTERPAPGSSWETDLRIPNVDCKGCVLQVIQWMAEHGYNRDGGYTYHHCATVNISRDPNLETDSAWSSFLRG